MRRYRDIPRIIFPLIVIALSAQIFAPRVPAAPLSLTESGSWNAGSFGIAQLTGAAGTNFTATQTSSANAVLMTIANTTLTGWNITVRKVDTTWNAGLHAFVRRTGAGTGTGTVAGGLTYQEITGTDLAFLSGTNNKASIPLQFQLTGLSVTVGAGLFSTTVFYTLTEF